MKMNYFDILTELMTSIDYDIQVNSKYNPFYQ